VDGWRILMRSAPTVCFEELSPLAEARKTTRLPCVAGRIGDRIAVVTTRPWCAPATTSRMWGGRRRAGADAGDVSRAHHGKRLLDARPACRRHTLQVLRHPHIDETVTIARVWPLPSSVGRRTLPVHLCM
jgi:predicted ATPase with chaperone activity